MLVQMVSRHTGRLVCFRVPLWQLYWWSLHWFGSIPSHSLPSRTRAGIQWTSVEVRAWCGEKVRHPLLSPFCWLTCVKINIMHLLRLESKLGLASSLIYHSWCVSVCFRWRPSVWVCLYLSRFFCFLLYRQVIKQIQSQVFKGSYILQFWKVGLRNCGFCKAVQIF